MSIRAVVFDVGGVLVDASPMDFDQRWEPALNLPTGSFGTTCADLWAAGAVGSLTEAAIYKEVGSRLNLTPDQVDAVMADMWVQYLGTANTEIIEYARALRPEYRTGILSNSFVGAREREQAMFGFEDLVDELVYSHEVGMSKPDPKVYALVCERLGVEPAETVFVDDVPQMVEGARGAGLHGVLFRGCAQAIGEVGALLEGGKGW